MDTLEQYYTDATTLEALRTFVLEHKVSGDSVLDACCGDMRCGTVVAQTLECTKLAGIDLDPPQGTSALKMDIMSYSEVHDVCVSNPPFGSKNSKAELTYKIIWKHIVELGLQTIILIPESKQSVIADIARETGRIHIRSQPMGFPIVGTRFESGNTIPFVKVRWHLLIKAIRRKVGSPVTVSVPSNILAPRVGVSSRKLEAELGKVQKPSSIVGAPNLEGQKTKFKLHLIRTPDKLESAIQRFTEHQVHQLTNPQEFVVCDRKCGETHDLGECIDPGVNDLIWLLSKITRKVSLDLDAALDALLSNEYEPFPIGDAINLAHSMNAKEDAVYGNFSRPDNYKVEQTAINRLMEAEKLRKKKAFLIGRSTVANRIIELSQWKHEEEESKFITRVLSIALAERIAVVTPSLSVIRFGNNFIATTSSISAMFNLSGMRTPTLFPSPLMDYCIHISEYDLGISVYLSSGSDTTGLVKQYVDLMKQTRGNFHRIRLSKFIMSLMKLIACGTNPKVLSANLPFIQGLGAEISWTKLSAEDISTLCCGELKSLPNNDLAPLLAIINSMAKRGSPMMYHKLLSLTALEKYRAIEFIDTNKSLQKYITRTTQKPHFDPTMDRKLIIAWRKLVLLHSLKTRKMPEMIGNSRDVEFLQQTWKIALSHSNNPQRAKNLFRNEIVGRVRIMNAIEGYSGAAPEEFLHDKACTRTLENIHCCGLTEKELSYFMMHKDQDLSYYIGKVRKTIQNAEPEVRVITNDSEFSQDLTTVKLNPKEKEQKIEGRNYGINTFEGKLGISQFTAATQIAASIVPMCFMALDDTEKAEQMHLFSNILQQKDTYFIGLDIVGHNQTFSPESMAGLITAVVDSVSGFDDYLWENVFRNLSAVLEIPGKECIVAIDRQNTAIEGWFVFLWGIHTALIMQVFEEETPGISCPGGSSYADDIGMLIRVTDDRMEVETAIEIISSFWSRFGQEVKPSQTMISDQLYTLLKTSYISGLPVDCSLKELCRFNPMSEDIRLNEYSAADSIQASEASYYEKAGTDFRMGRFVSRLLLVLSSVTLLSHCISSQKLIGGGTVPPNIKQIFQTHLHSAKTDRFQSLQDAISSGPNATSLLTMETQITSPVTLVCKELLVNGLKIPQVQRLIEKLIWYPRGAGGFGAKCAVHSMATGHSSPLLRTLSFLERYDKGHWTDLRRKLWSLAIFDRPSSSAGVLAKEEFPIGRDVIGDGSIITNHIAKALAKSRTVINDRIKSAASYVENGKYLCDKLVESTRSKLAFRIINFFLSESGHSYFEKMLSKVSSSRSVASFVGDISHLMNEIHRNTETRMSVFFSPSLKEPPSVGSNLQFLYEMRRTAFRGVKFLDVGEADFLDTMEEMSNPEIFCQSPSLIGMSTNQEVILEGGGVTIRRPARATLTGSKFRSLKDLVANPAELHVERLYQTSKWILKMSALAAKRQFTVSNNNIMGMLQITLRTWSHTFDINRLLLAQDPFGGQILHRIIHQKGKPVVGNHFPLQVSGAIGGQFTGKFFEDSGENNNVSFKLWELEVGMLTWMSGKPRSRWAVRRPENIVSVIHDFSTAQSEVTVENVPLTELLSKITPDHIAEYILQVSAAENGLSWISDSNLRIITSKLKRRGVISDDIELETIENMVREKELKVPRSDSQSPRYLSKISLHGVARLALGEEIGRLPPDEYHAIKEFLNGIMHSRYIARFTTTALHRFCLDLYSVRCLNLSHARVAWQNMITQEALDDLTEETFLKIAVVCRAMVIDYQADGAKALDRLSDIIVREKPPPEPEPEGKVIKEESALPRFDVSDIELTTVVESVADLNRPLLNQLSQLKQLNDFNNDCLTNAYSSCARDADPHEVSAAVCACLCLNRKTIVNVTAGRCHVASAYNSLTEAAEINSNMVCLKSADEYSSVFYRVETATKSKDINENTSVAETVCAEGDVLFVEMSFLRNARAVGKWVQSMRSTNIILIRPGKQWAPFWEGLKRKKENSIKVNILSVNLEESLHHFILLHPRGQIQGKEFDFRIPLKSMAMSLNKVIESPSIPMSREIQGVRSVKSWMRLFLSHHEEGMMIQKGQGTVGKPSIRKVLMCISNHFDVPESEYWKNHFALEDIGNILAMSNEVKLCSFKAWCGLVSMFLVQSISRVSGHFRSLCRESVVSRHIISMPKQFSQVCRVLEQISDLVTGGEPMNDRQRLWATLTKSNQMIPIGRTGGKQTTTTKEMDEDDTQLWEAMKTLGESLADTTAQEEPQKTHIEEPPEKAAACAILQLFETFQLDAGEMDEEDWIEDGEVECYDDF